VKRETVARRSYRPHRLDSARTTVRLEIVVRDREGRVKYVAQG